MAQKAVATPTAVAEAVEKLMQAGLNPTVAQVRDAVGGGSYTTISRYLSQILADRGNSNTTAADMPPDLAEIAHRAAVSIYSAIQKAADGRVEIIEHDAALRIKRAERTRLEAELEVENLEHQTSELIDQLDHVRAALQDASARAERTEGKAAATSSELQRIRDELAQARTMTELARNDVEKLRAELDRTQVKCATSTADIATSEQHEESHSRLRRVSERERSGASVT